MAQKYFLLKTDKDALSYKCGETMRLTITAKANPIVETSTYLRWELRADDGTSSAGYDRVSPGNPLVLETKISRPGFVHLFCVALTAELSEDPSFEKFNGGCGAEIEKLAYLDGEFSEQYDKYWAELEKLIDEYQYEIISCKPIEDERVPASHEAYDIQITTPEDWRPCSAIVTIPKGKENLPLTISYIGYGVTPCFVEPDDGIRINVNAHGIKNFKNRFDAEKTYKEIRGYGINGDDLNSPYTSYWRGMMIRDMIAVKYGKSLKQWDGKTLNFEGGSQGAFQATNMAAHTKGATSLTIFIPWYCNRRSEKEGYIYGWGPRFEDGVRMFDTVAAGLRVKCPVTITAYLGDYTCPPHSIAALYNSISTKKQITFIQGGTHGYRHPEGEKFYRFFDPENPTGEIKSGKYLCEDGKEYTVTEIGKDFATGENTVIFTDGENTYNCPEHYFKDMYYGKANLIERFKYLG